MLSISNKLTNKVEFVKNVIDDIKSLIILIYSFGENNLAILNNNKAAVWLQHKKSDGDFFFFFLINN